MIKPIQTAAYGRLFRSRLEARVACFLTHLGIYWEYEPEGYDLPCGYYLPDFFVKKENLHYWIECKKGPPNRLELLKAQQLANATDKPVFFMLPETLNELRGSGATPEQQMAANFALSQRFEFGEEPKLIDARLSRVYNGGTP